jgi:predicted dehydrogenase
LIPLRLTIVGCGAVAQRLYRTPLQQLERRGAVKVVSLVDPAADHAHALASTFPGARIHSALESALEATPSDAALILSPAHLHCQQTIIAFDHGNHVLCEKPMANSVAECDAMNSAAARAKRVLAIGMIRRYFPAFAELKRVIEAERLGELISFEYREGHKFEWEVTTAAAFRPRSAGGTGVLFDIGPHVIDHLAWTFGDLMVSAYTDDSLGGIESNLTMEVATPRCPGSVALSWDQPQLNELRVFGTKGEAALRIDRFDQLGLLDSDGWRPHLPTARFAADLAAPPRTTIAPRSYPQAMLAQLVQFVRAVTGGEPPAVDGASGRATIAALESSLSIARPLRHGWLDEAEQASFGRLHWNRR